MQYNVNILAAPAAQSAEVCISLGRRCFLAVTLLGCAGAFAGGVELQPMGRVESQPIGRVESQPMGRHEATANLQANRHAFRAPTFGAIYKMNIPPVAYTTTNGAGQRFLITGGGAALDIYLKMLPNGTYGWKDRGRNLQGRWIQTAPDNLVLKNFLGKDWTASVEMFGADQVGRLLLWSDWDRMSGHLVQ